MRNNERPKIKIELGFIDKLVEIVGWVLISIIWLIVLISYSKLPTIIPTHYDGYGIADGFGSKKNILILPIVATAVFVLLSIINRFPQNFNYPTNITQENALQQYTSATKLIRYLKLIISLIFGYITFMTAENALHSNIKLGIWFLPLIFVLIFIPVIYFIVKMLRKK